MPTTKYEDWPTKSEAARQIGVSVKTLERLVISGKIEQRFRQREGLVDIAVCSPRDVERHASRKAAERSKPFLPPAEAQPEQSVQSYPSLGQHQDEFVKALHLLECVLPKVLPKPAAEPLDILTIRQAMALGYSRSWLKEQLKEGNLRSYGRGRVSRFELRALAGWTG